MRSLIKSKRTAGAKLLHAPIVAIWVLLVVASGSIAISFDSKSGTVGHYPDAWPKKSRIKKAGDRMTLLMFLHPQCACSKASISELEKIVCRTRGLIETHVVFLSYAGGRKDWKDSVLVDAARVVPGVTITFDSNGEEASLFGAQTSGQTLLYDESGKLVFQGGITATRGHEGDNVGQQAVEALALRRATGCATNFVFGCPLFSRTEQ